MSTNTQAIATTHNVKTYKPLRHTVDVHNGSISFTETGAGEPVVLLHCSGADGKVWSPFAENYADKYRCLTVDHWNCGSSSSWEEQEIFTLDSEVRAIVQVIESTGSPVHVVGHSYGGAVALHVARQRPDLVHSLVLIEPSSFYLLKNTPPEERKFMLEITDVAAGMKKSRDTWDYWSAMAQFVNYWNGIGSWDRLSYKQQFKMTQQLDKVMLEFAAVMNESARRESYAAITQPTQLLFGEHSPAPSKHLVGLLAETIPHACTNRIRGAGHMSPMTHAEPVGELINRHIAANTMQLPLRFAGSSGVAQPVSAQSVFS